MPKIAPTGRKSGFPGSSLRRRNIASLISQSRSRSQACHLRGLERNWACNEQPVLGVPRAVKALSYAPRRRELQHRPRPRCVRRDLVSRSAPGRGCIEKGPPRRAGREDPRSSRSSAVMCEGARAWCPSRGACLVAKVQTTTPPHVRLARRWLGLGRPQLSMHLSDARKQTRNNAQSQGCSRGRCACGANSRNIARRPVDIARATSLRETS